MKYKVLQKNSLNGIKENQIVAHCNEGEDQQIVMSGNYIDIKNPKDAKALIRDKTVEDPDNPMQRTEDVTDLKAKIVELEAQLSEPIKEDSTEVEESQEYEEPEDKPVGRYEQLKALNRKQQNKICKKLKISGYSKMNEEDKIEAIMKAEA